ncbi:oligosaccharide flippase family protein [Hyphomonas oceanitis]|uniref:Putative exopolysaccharide export protein,possibly related with succinoglycan synthesis n=1 Tax=Hyphomonas oceanitis SCH89 TaxID=1280953 RepID=A0A059G3Z7_9PROT|nr:oligosaccharide flippase family protein [Hyphomonas oceanitis]KDA01434.1 putative exopolysaccharide export protein,possibly related with succinoglycan synthesis [Hyphomonas oceanitis SCH89]
MDKVRTAVIIATADKYVSTAITLVTTAIIARLINPAEFGVTVLGGAVLLMANTLRDVGTSSYIIQAQELTLPKLRAAFTLNLFLTLTILPCLVFAAPALASLLNSPGLDIYLKICAIPFAVGAIVYPLHALLARDFAFGKLAIINITSTIFNSTALICAAIAGASYLSFAFAQVVSALVGTALLIYFRPSFEIFRPSFSAWKTVLSFSLFSAFTGIVQRATEVLSVVAVGAFMPPAMVGLLSRASMIAQFPERTVMAGVTAAALPAFSEAAREKGDLRKYYLAALERISGLIWPCLALMIVLANPLIRLFLGNDWLETIPLVQIIAGALLLNFPPGLNYPILLAVGAVRPALLLAVLQASVVLPVITISAQYGIQAVAWATWPIVAINVVMSTWFVQAYVIRFSWLDIGRALSRSTIATIATVAGPITIVYLAGGSASIGLKESVLATGVGGVSWIGSLYLLKHPIYAEFARILKAVRRKILRILLPPFETS